VTEEGMFTLGTNGPNDSTANSGVLWHATQRAAWEAAKKALKP